MFSPHIVICCGKGSEVAGWISRASRVANLWTGTTGCWARWPPGPRVGPSSCAGSCSRWWSRSACRLLAASSWLWCSERKKENNNIEEKWIISCKHMLPIHNAVSTSNRQLIIELGWYYGIFRHVRWSQAWVCPVCLCVCVCVCVSAQMFTQNDTNGCGGDHFRCATPPGRCYRHRELFHDRQAGLCDAVNGQECQHMNNTLNEYLIDGKLLWTDVKREGEGEKERKRGREGGREGEGIKRMNVEKEMH